MVQSYNYTIKNGGIDSATAYPYTAKTGTCSYKAGNAAAKFSSWVQVSGSPDGTGTLNTSNVQMAVATQGPVAIGFDANSQFMSVKVPIPPQCNQRPSVHPP